MPCCCCCNPAPNGGLPRGVDSGVSIVNRLFVGLGLLPSGGFPSISFNKINSINQDKNK